MIVMTQAFQYTGNEIVNINRAAKWASDALRTLSIQETRSVVVDVFGASYSECQKLLDALQESPDTMTVYPVDARKFVHLIGFLLTKQGMTFDSVPGLLISSIMSDLTGSTSSNLQAQNHYRYALNG